MLWLLVIGISVSVLHLQLLTLRLLRDRLTEFGIYLNIGISRAKIVALILAEHSTYTLVGFVGGLLIGCSVVFGVSAMSDAPLPTVSSMAFTSLVPASIVFFGAIPISLGFALIHFTRARGVARVR